MKDIPYEVMFVWTIQQRKQPIGMDTMETCKNIIEKYPEYFPWEHKYDKIPAEVHEAFRNEAYPQVLKVQHIESGRGLMDHIDQYPVCNEISLEGIQELFKHMEESDRKEQEYKKRITQIWDKHYKKYGLPCREF